MIHIDSIEQRDWWIMYLTGQMDALMFAIEEIVDRQEVLDKKYSECIIERCSIKLINPTSLI